MARTLLIPVENQVRELDAKLLFSCAAAERGFPVVIGSKQFLYAIAPRYRNSILVAKSMRKGSQLIFNIMRGLGNDIIAWDEESLVRYCGPEYFSWRFSKGTFDPLTYLFSWGEDDLEMFRQYPEIGDVSIHATGNPRGDLLRSDVRPYFEEEQNKLRERYGEFILVNSNFPFVNPFVKRLTLVSGHDSAGARTVSRVGSGMSVEFAQGMSNHAQKIFGSFLELMPKLASWFPDRRIVIRPHPSEDHEVWRATVKGYENALVIHEGSVVPWLMASGVLLHNGCTTAVEGAALGVPAVAYRPVQDDRFDYHLPNSLSRQAMTEEEVREQIEGVLDKRPGTPTEKDIERILSRHLASQVGPLASDRILDVLSESKLLSSQSRRRPGMAYLKAYATAQGRTLVKRINAHRKDHWNSTSYHSHRFPDISAAEINNRILRFARVLGRFDGVEATQISKHVFQIERRRQSRT